MLPLDVAITLGIETLLLHEEIQQQEATEMVLQAVEP